MNLEKLKGLQIRPEQKRRPQRVFWSIVLVVAAVLPVEALPPVPVVPVPPVPLAPPAPICSVPALTVVVPP